MSKSNEELARDATEATANTGTYESVYSVILAVLNTATESANAASIASEEARKEWADRAIAMKSKVEQKDAELEKSKAVISAIQAFMGNGSGFDEVLQVIADRVAVEAILPNGEYEAADGMEDVVRWMWNEIKELREDKEALDWLETTTQNKTYSAMWSDVKICGPQNHGAVPGTHWLVEVESDEHYSESTGPTLRSAIANARKDESK